VVLKRLTNWWQRTPITETGSGPSATSESTNSSIHVSVRDLVGERRYANQIDLQRLVRARANSVGGQTSRFRGRGMDYQESRVYQPGDDIRNMDWRVTARAGRPHVKVYEEERERPVFFMVDFRPGMFFASRGALKSVVAARLAALLAWAAADAGDRIGALIVGFGEKELRPVRGKRGVLALIRQLVLISEPTQGMTGAIRPGRLSEALARMNRIVRPGSLVFIVSDFHDTDESTGKIMGRLAEHADVVVIRPVDALEKLAPPENSYVVTDGESLRTLEINGQKAARSYAEHFRQQDETILSMLKRHRIAMIEVATDEDIVRRLGGNTVSSSRSSESKAAAAPVSASSATAELSA